FYRLSVVTIVLPPLRERKDDIPLLAHHFLQSYAAANDRPAAIAPEAMALLVAHDWPGNVRELQHAVERAAALARNPVVCPEDLPPKFSSARPAESGAAALSLQEVVKGHLRRVLCEAGWNKKLAAELLGIHRRTLYRLGKRYGIALATRASQSVKRQRDEGNPQ